MRAPELVRVLPGAQARQLAVQVAAWPAVLAVRAVREIAPRRQYLQQVAVQMRRGMRCCQPVQTEQQPELLAALPVRLALLRLEHRAQQVQPPPG